MVPATAPRQAALEHLVAMLPQGRVAHRGSEAKALSDGITFLMHPAHPRPSPRDIGLKGLCQCGVAEQAFGQHARILHRHAAALTHHR